jgi:hypothetical protein
MCHLDAQVLVGRVAAAVVVDVANHGRGN